MYLLLVIINVIHSNRYKSGNLDSILTRKVKDLMYFTFCYTIE